MCYQVQLADWIYRLVNIAIEFCPIYIYILYTYIIIIYTVAGCAKNKSDFAVRKLLVSH